MPTNTTQDRSLLARLTSQFSNLSATVAALKVPAQIRKDFTGSEEVFTGAQKFIYIPANFTLTDVTVLTDQDGDLTLDIYKGEFAGYPPSTSICASAPPTLTTQSTYQDATLVGWTTLFEAGSTLIINIDSVATITSFEITLSGYTSLI